MKKPATLRLNEGQYSKLCSILAEERHEPAKALRNMRRFIYMMQLEGRCDGFSVATLDLPPDDRPEIKIVLEKGTLQ
jgi:hypothetical protein